MAAPSAISAEGFGRLGLCVGAGPCSDHPGLSGYLPRIVFSPASARVIANRRGVAAGEVMGSQLMGKAQL
jgi:hypothetical protein